MIIIFWTLSLLLVYTFVGYGLIIILLSLLRQERKIPDVKSLRVCMLIAAHNEEKYLDQKLANTLSLDRGFHHLDILVVSDGSTDRTTAIVRKYAASGVKLVELPQQKGKIVALNTGLGHIDSDIIVFSDANSMLRSDALIKLVRHFGDPDVGGVCGRLLIPANNGNWLSRTEALFWKYDHALKIAESSLAGAVSAQGSLYAIRRELVCPLPPAVADDLVNSLRVVARGKRLVFEPEAVSEEDVTSNLAGEFTRRVRSTEQGVRGLCMMSQLLNPLRYGFYSIQLFSHKVLRRLSPFILLLLLPANIIIANQHYFYAVTALIQTGFYLVALVAWMVPAARRFPGFSHCLFFTTGNISMALGVCNILSGRKTMGWNPVR